VKQALKSIVELGAEDHRDSLRKLLRNLFPATEWAFDGPNYAEEYGQQWYRDLRVCSPKMFDRYFRLTVSDEELSQAVIQNLLDARGNREHLRTLLESQNAQGRLNASLEELAIHEDELEPTEVEPYITAIFDIGDLLSETERGGFEIPIQWRVSWIVRHSLEKIENVESRFEVFANAVNNTTGLNMVTEVIAVLISKSDDDTREPILPETKADEIREIGLRKIENSASSGKLAESPRLRILLHLWRVWGKEEDVSNYTDRMSPLNEAQGASRARQKI